MPIERGRYSQSPRLDRGARVVIVEDEPLARRSLRSVLDTVEWIERIGEAVNADEAISLIRASTPDLIFLDVQLPGGSGLDVLRRTETDAVIIFATAFDAFALAAFELGAIDYVTKPFGPERVHRALDRAVAQLQARHDRRVAAVTEVSPPVTARLDAGRTRPLATIFVRDRGLVLPIRVSDIIHLEADGDFVAVHTDEHRHLVYLNLGDVCEQLDPEAFVRVHRSHVVNVAAIRTLRSLDASRVELTLRDGSVVPASRAGTRALRHVMRAQRDAPPRSL